MGNLIDRGLLIKKLDEHCNTVCQYPKSIRDVMCGGCPLGTAFDVIDELPSAEPEIIRCKDCKYASPNGEYGCKAYHFKLYETHEMKADDFCSKAERRTDE